MGNLSSKSSRKRSANEPNQFFSFITKSLKGSGVKRKAPDSLHDFQEKVKKFKPLETQPIKNKNKLKVDLIPYPQGYIQDKDSIDCTNWPTPKVCDPSYALSCINCSSSVNWTCAVLKEAITVKDEDGKLFIIEPPNDPTIGYCLPISYLQKKTNPYTTLTVLAFNSGNWQFQYLCKYPALYTQKSETEPCVQYQNSICLGRPLKSVLGVVDKNFSPGFDPWYDGICDLNAEDLKYYVPQSGNIGPSIRLRTMDEAIPDFNKPTGGSGLFYISSSDTAEKLQNAGYSSAAVTRLRLTPGIWVPRPCKICPITGKTNNYNVWRKTTNSSGCDCSISHGFVGALTLEGGAGTGVVSHSNELKGADILNCCIFHGAPRDNQLEITYAMYLYAGQYFESVVTIKLDSSSFKYILERYHPFTSGVRWSQNLANEDVYIFNVWREWYYKSKPSNVVYGYQEGYMQEPNSLLALQYEAIKTKYCSSQYQYWDILGNDNKRATNDNIATLGCKKLETPNFILYLFNPKAAENLQNNFYSITTNLTLTKSSQSVRRKFKEENIRRDLYIPFP